MSSPTRYNRSVLSPKPNNTRSPSPSKANSFESPQANSRLRLSSPTKQKPVATSISASTSSSSISALRKKSASPQKSAGFIIFEDPVRYVAEEDSGSLASSAGSADHPPLDKENSTDQYPPALSNKQNHNDQENILQPSKKILQHLTSSSSLAFSARKPLAQLSISDFPGYIAYPSTRKAKLTEPWIPSNSDNDQKSLHKFQTRIPSFITPPRNSKFIRLDSIVKDFASTTLQEKYLFKSNVPMFNEEDEEEEALNTQKGDETDELELRLQRKEKALLVRKRSHSVGKNESKLKLIKKNNFQILSTEC